MAISEREELELEALTLSVTAEYLHAVAAGKPTSDVALEAAAVDVDQAVATLRRVASEKRTS